MDNLSDLKIIDINDETISKVKWRFVKRIFDLIFSLTVAILLLSWLIPLISLLIKLSSRGPVFFLQDRIGLNNEKFRCIKFRSMYTGNEKRGKIFSPTFENDRRVTGFGKLLRRLNLDELPQFWNVIKGEMSIVGPRPLAVPFGDDFKIYSNAIILRQLVKPGLTGWAQVHGLRGEVADRIENRNRTVKRIEYDIWYIRNWSCRLDIRIIILTVWQMITNRTAAH